MLRFGGFGKHDLRQFVFCFAKPNIYIHEIIGIIEILHLVFHDVIFQ